MAAKALGVALVTGASQGIGRAIALRLAKDGFKVAVNDIPSKEEQLQTVSREVQKLNGQKAQCVVADVSKETEVGAMVDSVSNTLGGLDVMVANAGIIIRSKQVVDYTTEEWDRIFSVNARGVFLCYKYAAKQMIAQGNGGRIIGCSSLAGRKAGAESSAYCASKFAVRGLTQSAALELGQHGITVNAYAPGFTKTALNETFWDNPKALMAKYGLAPSSFFKLGDPDDIASVVSFLASKDAHYITGQTISPNGGALFD
jgi:NAD(P)-dependent dehydrogenase (short-subunit alcohol dehydrogenase family)